MRSKKPRDMGELLLEMEELIDEMLLHGLQWGDLLNLVHGHLVIHRQDAKEIYTEDGSSPIFFYGPKEQK